MPSTKVLNQSDARPWHFQELLPSNGKWRVVFFVGDITVEQQRHKLDAVGKALDDKTSFLNCYTPPGAAFDAVFEVLAVHSSPRTKVTIFDFPSAFRHYDDVEGYDYSKIFADDISYHEGYGQVYETFKVSSQGCAVIIRPDQYISYVGPMEDVEPLSRFFAGFMLSPLLPDGTNGTGGANGTNGAGIDGAHADVQAVDLRIA